MPQNLFAACVSEGGIVAKRVQLNNDVQAQVIGLFAEQEVLFRDGVVEEIAFNGTWKPDDDEVLTIPIPADTQALVEAIEGDPLALPVIQTGSFSDEGIKALFTGGANGGATKVLVQRFTAQQLLERRFSLLGDGNTFRRLTEPAFALDTSLMCIIEGGHLKFKSQHKLRTLVNMVDIYRAATEPEVRQFAAHAALAIADVDAFVAVTNQTSRKLIAAIASAGTLDEYNIPQIQAAAAATDLDVAVENDRIVMPTEHREIKALLQFLDESRYSGPLSGQAYVTNSRRTV